jgi:hypothetical protein
MVVHGIAWKPLHAGIVVVRHAAISDRVALGDGLAATHLDPRAKLKTMIESGE